MWTNDPSFKTQHTKGTILAGTIPHTPSNEFGGERRRGRTPRFDELVTHSDSYIRPKSIRTTTSLVVSASRSPGQPQAVQEWNRLLRRRGGYFILLSTKHPLSVQQQDALCSCPQSQIHSRVNAYRYLKQLFPPIATFLESCFVFVPWESEVVFCFFL